MHFLACIFFFFFLVCWDVTLLHILSLLIVNLNQIQLWSLFNCSVSHEVSFPKLLEGAVSQVLRSFPVSLFHFFHVKNNDEFVGHSLCLSFWRSPRLSSGWTPPGGSSPWREAGGLVPRVWGTRLPESLQTCVDVLCPFAAELNKIYLSSSCWPQIGSVHLPAQTC